MTKNAANSSVILADYEKYIIQVLEQMFGDRFCSNVFYGSSETEACDGLIFYPNDLILIEVKSSKFRLKTTATGETQEYIKDLQRFFIKGAEQLHNRIKDWKDGKIKSEKIKDFLSFEVKNFHPILIVPECFPQQRFLWNLLSEELGKRNLLQDRDISRLQVIDAEELEIIEAMIKKRGFLDLLKTKLEDEVTADESMKNFIVRKYGGSQPVNLQLDKTFKEIGAQAIEYVFGK